MPKTRHFRLPYSVNYKTMLQLRKRDKIQTSRRVFTDGNVTKAVSVANQPC